MDQKHLSTGDIEACKELFAYEMTEVVLMLKGEFATVSGKELGLSQSLVSKELRDAPKEALSNIHIPAIEVRPTGLSNDAILQNPSSFGAAFSRANADGRQPATIKLNVALPVHPTVSPLPSLPILQADAPCPAAISALSRVQIPKTVFVKPPSPQIAFSPAKNLPAIHMQSASVLRKCVHAPAVPHLHIKAAKMHFEPSPANIPHITSFAQTCRPATHSLRPESLPNNVVPFSGLKAPCVPTISAISLSQKSLNIPAVHKVSVPDLSPTPVNSNQNHAIHAYADSLTKARTGSCAIPFPRIIAPTAETPPTISESFLDTIKRFSIKSEFAVTPPSRFPCEIPQITQHTVFPSIAVSDATTPRRIPLPAISDPRNELDAVRSALIK